METKKENWFVRSLIIALCLLITALVICSFFGIVQNSQINSGIIVLLAFLIILALSEAFDNFSVAQIFTLSKTVEEKEKLNTELKQDNRELKNQIISISTNISQNQNQNQNQSNSTIILTEALAKMLSVRQAEDPEKQQKQEEVDQENISTTTTTTATPESHTQRLLTMTRYEDLALKKFLTSEGLQHLPIVRDAKFTNLFQQIDPISEFSPIFDGYIKTFETELFIEMKFKNRSLIMLRERLYLMLSKINYYRNIKRINSYLYLVLIIRPDDENNLTYLDKLKKDFEPAILSGLLIIKEIEITTEESQSIINNA